MRKSRFTGEQVLQALRQGEAGTRAVEICLKLGITQPTFFRWRRKFGGLEASEVRELKQLRDDNLRLKQLVAALKLDMTILRDPREKW